MKRYILTGTPGAGKTSIIRILETMDYFVIEEAATDIIALEQTLGNKEPWLMPLFIDKIVNLQKQRQVQLSCAQSRMQFFDRSPLCTYALCQYLGYQYPSSLLEEIDRIEKKQIYQKKVFFIENLGVCKPTEARKISFEESLYFEKVHEEVYNFFGYECIKIPQQAIQNRVNQIIALV
ncbi:ATP/GTP-binding protein [Rickettsiales endosymbiont of Stachyamoeba lipophora]|uniref:ATP/GTP-binding protein n=1 Tax=Rickettsiales endosymbiont of Stachyamoeba lipophora TaxID=2486578 RepID=UPI000F64D1C5|nr:AAA family ATPase [Rickettsiales endosymbiont of Stachyamoeba lipophora]AZL16062.1 ATPase [Rickettsiales endosymbiont of Stachyamoeba lipophora]